MLAQTAHQQQTVGLRHHDVNNNHVGLQAINRFKGCRRVLNALDNEARPRREALHDGNDLGVVLDHQHRHSPANREVQADAKPVRFDLDIQRARSLSAGGE